MNNDVKIIKLIAVYARVSTSLQEEKGTIDNQLYALREYAKENNYTIVKEYVDEGWSGDILERPQLDELRQDAQDKIWEAVLIYDPDRLARRYSYQELVCDELRNRDVEVMFITIPAPKNPEDRMLHGMKGLFAEYERVKIAERFRLGKIRKIRQGHIIVSEPLYGYYYIPKKENVHGYYKINPEEAEVVRMMFSWVADEGLSIRGVVRKLQEMDIKPRKSKRGVWNTSTLNTLLHHKAYIGEAHWGSSYAVEPKKPQKDEKYRKVKKTSRKIRPKEDWYIIPVPSIIEKEVFEKAQKQFRKNSVYSNRNKKREYLLAGKIKCKCGRGRLGEGPRGGKYLYYRCSDRIYSFPLPTKCEEGGINARIADQLVWDKISELMSSPELLNKQAIRWLKSQQTKTKAASTDIDLLKTKIEKFKKQEDRYNKAYGAEALTLGQLKEYTAPVRERIVKLETQIADVMHERNRKDTNKIPDKNEIEVFTKKVVKALQNLNYSTKREIVLNTVEKIIGTQQSLQVFGYIPVNNHVSFKTNHRYGLNAMRYGRAEDGSNFIPFTLTIKLPPPLKRGVDYGFNPKHPV